MNKENSFSRTVGKISMSSVTIIKRLRNHLNDFTIWTIPKGRVNWLRNSLYVEPYSAI